MFFCGLQGERKRKEVNKTTVFLAVIWFTVCWGLKYWISRNILKRNLIWCSFVGYTHLPIFSKVNTWNIREYRSSGTYINSPKSTLTAWKVSKYGFISGPYFPVFQLNTDIYSVNLCIQSEYRKIRNRNNFVFGHFSRSDLS